MIKKATAVKIWQCYMEIEKGKKLVEEIKSALDKNEEPDLRDVFGGSHSGLQLGIPSGTASTTLMDLRPELGIKIIEAHIADNENKLVALKEISKIELNETT